MTQLIILFFFIKVNNFNLTIVDNKNDNMF